MRKIFKLVILLFVINTYLSAINVGGVDLDVTFETVDYEANIPTEISSKVPLAQKPFLQRIFKTIDWNAFAKSLEVRGINFSCGWEALKDGKTHVGLVGLVAGLIEPVRLIEIVQKPLNIAVFGLDFGSKANFIKFGVNVVPGRITNFHMIPFPIMAMFLKAFPRIAEFIVVEDLTGPHMAPYLSELDPTSKNSFMLHVMHPEMYAVLVPQILLVGGLASCLAAEALDISQQCSNGSAACKVPRPDEGSVSYNGGGYMAVLDAIFPMNGCIGVKLMGAHVQSDVGSESLLNMVSWVFWTYGKLGVLKQTVKSIMNGWNKEVLCGPLRSPFGYIHTQFVFQLVTPRISSLLEIGVNNFHLIAKDDGSTANDTAALLWQRRHYVAGAYQAAGNSAQAKAGKGYLRAKE
ncbi:MAG: Unknown protein [uncultured Campylobacterales bacterium]|uniref:Uncharacterized protein n=1 Tax=uncultured Campylobacterales bacterium TaxID=352960 RepID=A0A6S6TK94_9BACT|nr:MAG: Unknown protein [uncultured Campylobacterales bacterium]